MLIWGSWRLRKNSQLQHSANHVHFTAHGWDQVICPLRPFLSFFSLSLSLFFFLSLSFFLWVLVETQGIFHLCCMWALSYSVLDLVPDQRSNLGPLGVWSLGYWTTREAPRLFSILLKKYLFIWLHRVLVAAPTKCIVWDISLWTQIL